MKKLDKAFEIAARALPAAGIDCLLIGGLAVNHYGYTRNTLELIGRQIEELGRT